MLILLLCTCAFALPRFNVVNDEQPQHLHQNETDAQHLHTAGTGQQRNGTRVHPVPRLHNNAGHDSVEDGEDHAKGAEPADTNKELFERNHDRTRRESTQKAPPANGTSTNGTSTKVPPAKVVPVKFVPAKVASANVVSNNATATRDRHPQQRIDSAAGGAVRREVPVKSAPAGADECLRKAACLYGVAQRRLDDAKRNEIRAAAGEKECLDEVASFLLEYAGKVWPGQGQQTKDAVYTGYHSGKADACGRMYVCQTVFTF